MIGLKTANKDAFNCVSQKIKRVGILGGTFNPPHMGHLFMAKRVLNELSLDEVTLLPVGDPPHKKDVYVESSFHRLNMTSLTCEGENGLFVSDIEALRPGYTYTVDTLRGLTEKCPETRFYYIIGEDTLFEIENWREHETVFKMTAFVCVRRPGGREEELFKKISQLKEKGAEIILSKYTGPDISSTEIRKRIEKEESTEGLLKRSVREYIDVHKLYR